MTLKKNHLYSLNEESVWTQPNNHTLPFPLSIFQKSNIHKLKNSFIIFTVLNFFWLIFRTGSKPSRIAYPCQHVALNNISRSLFAYIPLSITGFFLTKKNKVISQNKIIISAILILGLISGGLFFKPFSPNSSEKLQLIIESQSATIFPASDIYVVNGSNAKISKLINLMSSNGLFFYRSSVLGENQGPDGLIDNNDVILIKINSQWSERGGTNTDVLLELIQTIIDHPDGFLGEIVVADNGQGRGNMNYGSNNAEDRSQSTQDVVDMFSSINNISTYDWQKIRNNRVSEYSEGDMTDGYILFDYADPETGIFVSYPKFKTEFGTRISFKHGVWNETGYEKRLKVINLPVLKSHLIYGVTASVKNYMGVQSEVLAGGLANGHSTVATGGMGTLLVECGLPTLNIIDAIWVNANPYPSSSTGPSTSYNEATKLDLLVAGVDPIALDYWAAKHILVQTASLIGYDDTKTLDPDIPERNGLRESFGVWLNLTKSEIQRVDLNVTTDENSMNIISDFQNNAQTGISSQITTGSYVTSTKPVPGFDSVVIILSITASIPFFSRIQRKRSKKVISKP